MNCLQYQFYLVKLKGNCTCSHKQSTLPLTTSRPDEECTIQHTHIKKRTCTVRLITHVHVPQHTCTKESYMYSTFDVTHVHVTQHTCTKAVHVSTQVHVTQNVHVSTIKIIPGLTDQPSAQNLQAL